MARFEDLRKAAAQTEVCLSTLPGFNPPTQHRTRQKTDLIVAAAAFLLQSRRFSDISVQDIAARAGCSVTSIYARFHDKKALLPAVNLIILEHYSATLSARFDPEKANQKTIEDFSNEFVKFNTEFFEENRNFITASIVNDSEYTYQQTDQRVKSYVDIIKSAIQALMGHEPNLEAIAFGIRLIISVHRDSIIGGLHSGMSDKAALARLFSTIITEDLAAPA